MSVNYTTLSFETPIEEWNKASLWSVFDQSWTSVMGYPAEKFEFTPEKTFMSTSRETVAAIVLYYTTILGVQELMRDRPAFRLNKLFLAHNLFLTLLSGALLALFIEQLVPTVWRHGIYFGICGSGGWTKPLVVLYYLNYLTKYFELLDTVFLVLKKKPLTWLHCYHHGATAVLCYTQLKGHTSVSWVPITLNLTVHVVMYWYYFQSARGIRISWKKWITRLQIAQFVIDLGFIYFASWNFYSSAHRPSLPHVGVCAGEEYAAAMGCVILSSYLVLFISFYFATYKKAGKSRKGMGKMEQALVAAPQQALTDMNTTELPDITQTSEKAVELIQAVNHGVATRKPGMLISALDGNL